MPYNPALVAPMRAEVTRLGAKELTTAAEVDAALGDQKGPCWYSSTRSAAVRPATRGRRWPWRSTRWSPAGRHRLRRPGPGGRGPGAPVLRGVSAQQPLHGAAPGRRGGPFRPPPSDRGPLAQSIAADLTAAFDKFCGARSLGRHVGPRLSPGPRRASRDHGRSRDSGSRTYVGRYDSEDAAAACICWMWEFTTEGAAVSRDDYIRKSAKFGIRSRTKHLVIPADQVARITR